MDKLFHHNNKSEEQSRNSRSGPNQESVKESEIDKIKTDIKNGEQRFKDYIKKDEAMEREGNGNEYGGLM